VGVRRGIHEEWTGVSWHPSAHLPLPCFAVQAFAAQHFACPFGAVGSVHGWERIGAAVCHVAVVFLRLALLRYVDDYFGPEG